MPFIPHTEEDTAAMLAAIGAQSIEELFDEIPDDLRLRAPLEVGPALSEMAVNRLMTERARLDGAPLAFLGAGAYEHHIPAAVWEITTRGEFYSAYTPYQAEASQGTLQVIYEYQTMMASLTGLDVSNASLYDGATALAEAVLMAIRANRKAKSRRVLIPGTLHPDYRRVVAAITETQGIELFELPWDAQSGTTDVGALGQLETVGFAAVVLCQPNFFGALEDVDTLTRWAHQQGALVIAQVNPTSLALLQPPGRWGESGADIACGEGQPLGVPLSSGGPYFGFLTSKQALVRQMPGRIAGRTVDLDGNPGFTLTLQAREQHIRRSKATSNICTNQGLMVTAATIYMSLLGPDGLRRVAATSHAQTVALVERLRAIPGTATRFSSPFFHEAVVELPVAAEPVLARMANNGVLGGIPLGDYFDGFANCLLVCATETKTADDLDRWAETLQRAIEQEKQNG